MDSRCMTLKACCHFCRYFYGTFCSDMAHIYVFRQATLQDLKAL